MTASFAIEAGVLGAASVLGVSKLYDLEKYSARWPDSFIAFGMVIGWMLAAAFSLATSLLALKGVEVDGSRWVLLTVVMLSFVTHALKRAGLLKTTVLDDDQERDPQPPIDAVARARLERADHRT